MQKAIALLCALMVLGACGEEPQQGDSGAAMKEWKHEGIVVTYDEVNESLTVSLDANADIERILVPTEGFAYVKTTAGSWTLDGVRFTPGKGKRALWHYHNTVVLRAGIALKFRVKPQERGTIIVDVPMAYDPELKAHYSTLRTRVWTGKGELK